MIPSIKCCFNSVVVPFFPGTKAYLTFSSRLSSGDDFAISLLATMWVFCFLSGSIAVSFWIAVYFVFSLFSDPFGFDSCFVTGCSPPIASTAISLVPWYFGQAPRTGALLYWFQTFCARARNCQPGECPSWGAFLKDS